MDNEMRIIDFDKYCDTCQYKDLNGFKDPCNECLDNPAVFESSIPVNYKKKEEKKEEKGSDK